MFTVPRSPLSLRVRWARAVALFVPVAAICLVTARDQSLPDSVTSAALSGPPASVPLQRFPSPPVPEQVGTFWASLR